MALKVKIFQTIEKNLLFVMIRTAVILILALLAVVFFGSGIKKLNVELIEKRSRLASTTNLIDNLVSLRSDEKKAEIILPTLSATLPDADDVVIRTVGDLENLAVKNTLKSAVTLEAASSATETEPAGVNFKIALSGTGPAFLNYLKDLENLSYFIKLINIDLRGPGGLINPAEINFAGKIYIKK
ncbi:MAG: hypothetical protein HYV52_01350 [Parcubacteria group bacterium]|nr:hypothetical protein [Parcubacteria group bacterium]